MNTSAYLGEPAPDKQCPVCEIPVKFEAGYYDTKPIYRCNQCGLVVKDRSPLAVAGMILAVVMLVTISSCMMTQILVNRTTPLMDPVATRH